MMNVNPQVLAALALTVLLGGTGCGRKTDANSELQRASEATGAAPSAQPAQATQSTQTGAPTPQTPVQQVDQARTALKAGNYHEAVTQLHTVLAQGSSGKMPMTPQQYMAVQDAAGAMLNDLYVRASKGDANARQAVKEYERLMHSH